MFQAPWMAFWFEVARWGGHYPVDSVQTQRLKARGEERRR